MFEVLAWCSAIQAGWRRHTWAPLLGSPQDDGVIHTRIVATPVEPLLVKPPPWWLPTQEDSLSDIFQFVEMPTQVSPKYDINFDQLWSDAVSSSHAFIVAGRPYHHWGRPLIETHLRQIERPLTTPDLEIFNVLGHGDGRWRRRPQAVKRRGEDEMKRGGRGRRRAHGEAPPGADLVVGGKKATPSSTSVRSPRQLYCCNIQEGSLHSFSVLQEKVHKKQHTASQKLQSLLAIEQIHS